MSDWREQALCAQVDTDIFFPDRGSSLREAKSICRGCDVAPECLRYALDHHVEFGIWGGLLQKQRRHLNRNDSGAVA